MSLRRKPQCLYALVSWVTHHFHRFPFIWSKSLNPTHTQGKGISLIFWAEIVKDCMDINYCISLNSFFHLQTRTNPLWSPVACIFIINPESNRQLLIQMLLISKSLQFLVLPTPQPSSYFQSSVIDPVKTQVRSQPISLKVEVQVFTVVGKFHGSWLPLWTYLPLFPPLVLWSQLSWAATIK